MPSTSSLVTRLSCAVFAALVALAACGDDGGTGPGTGGTTQDTSTGTGTTAPTGSATGPELPAECACLESGCGESLCATIAAGCPESCPQDFSVDEDAVTCALEALRDGTPGLLAWSYSPNGGGTSEWGMVSILADRHAIREGGYDMGICGGNEATVRGPLNTPEHFADCLTESSAEARFDCVRGALAATDVVCRPAVQGCGDNE